MDTQEKEYKKITGQPEAATSEHQSNAMKDAEQKRVVQDDEIDLVELVKKIWAERRVVYIIVPVFFFLGIFIAVVSPEEYTAETTLMPQSGSSGAASIGSGVLQQFGLGGLGGGSAASGGNLGVDLYPDITHSTPFLMQLIQEEFYFSSLDTTVTLFTYFSEIKSKPFTTTLKQYTLGIPRVLINVPVGWANSLGQQERKIPDPQVQEGGYEGEDATPEIDTSPFMPVVVSSQQLVVMNYLKERIITTVEPNGTLLVSGKMPDPLVAAEVTEMAVIFLTNYVKDYKVDKAREDLDFIQAQFEEKEDRYNQAQSRLARLRDRNMNIVSESARIELERAQTEFNLAFNLYQSIAQQLEQAKIKLQEETPLFKVLEPVQVPLSKSEPNQELIVLLFTFGGAFLGFCIIFFKVIYQQFKQSFS